MTDAHEECLKSSCLAPIMLHIQEIKSLKDCLKEEKEASSTLQVQAI